MIFYPCNPHHNHDGKHFQHLKGSLIPIFSHFPTPAFYPCQTLNCLLSFISRISYKWNHVVCSFSFSIPHLKPIHVVACFSGSLFYCWIIFYYMNNNVYLLYIHQLMSVWIVCDLWLLWIMLLRALIYTYHKQNHICLSDILIYLYFLGKDLKCGVAESYGKCILIL